MRVCLRDDLDGSLTQSATPLVQRRLQPEPKSTLSQWTTATLLLFVVVDLLAYLYVFSSIFHDISAPEPELEFRSPYRGLDDLYGSGEANSSKHDPIENVPRVAAIVNSEHPHQVYPQDEHRWLSPHGTVTPLDRHFKVSSTVRNPFSFSCGSGADRLAVSHHPSVQSHGLWHGTVCSRFAPTLRRRGRSQDRGNRALPPRRLSSTRSFRYLMVVAPTTPEHGWNPTC